MRPTHGETTGSFERAVEGVLTLDDDGVCLDANPAACALYGRAAGELVGAAIATLDAEPDEARWQRLLGGQETTAELEVGRPDGATRAVEVSYLGTCGERHLLVLRDIGERL